MKLMNRFHSEIRTKILLTVTWEKEERAKSEAFSLSNIRKITHYCKTLDCKIIEN